ncbi:MAG: type I-G CRISPR-associated RAMP protein Csb1/Cas7g [Thermoanaerobaculia bacterium]
MKMNLDALATEPRLLAEAELVPAQGTRFQPTGFPNLGAATYRAAGGARMLLVESAQSMANRLEAVCWDEEEDKLVAELEGLPYVEAVLPNDTRTSSIIEAHRLNSPYIVNSPEFEQIAKAIGFRQDAPFDRRKLATTLFRYDPNSLLHGIFLEKVGGVVRLPRALSAFIEASSVEEATSGGVKFDRVQPETRDSTPYGRAEEGYGNVPFARDEYTAESIKAFFNLDLALIRGYGLGAAAERMLILLALFKIAKFLEEGLRLRTACDLEAAPLVVRKPQGFEFPALLDLRSAVKEAITAAASLFADPRKLVVRYEKKAKAVK